MGSGSVSTEYSQISDGEGLSSKSIFIRIGVWSISNARCTKTGRAAGKSISSVQGLRVTLMLVASGFLAH